MSQSGGNGESCGATGHVISRGSEGQNLNTQNGQTSESDAYDGEGGGDSVDSGSSKKYNSEEELKVISQTKVLLSRYLVDTAERDNMPRRHYETLCQTLNSETHSPEYSGIDEDLLANVIKIMGDDLFHAFDDKINVWISSVPMQSAEVMFSKVSKQMFSDGEMNWGRIAVLFYLAYRFIAKAFNTTKDWSSWIKTILRIAMDFFCKFYINWVVRQGGWKKIMEYYKSSSTAAVALTVLTIVAFIYCWYCD